MLEDKEDSYHQAEVTDDIDNQGLLCRRNSRTPLIPEAYQQERSQANQSPTHEQEKKVVRAYQQHHRKNKKVKEGEVAPETRVVFHITGRVYMNEEADACNHHQHSCRKGIEKQAKTHCEWIGPCRQARVYPGVEHLIAEARRCRCCA